MQTSILARTTGAVVAGLFAVSIAACSSSNSSDGAKGFDCSVCQVLQFDCAVGPNSGQATIASSEATGCSGTITGGDETNLLWIRCDTGQICVEHEDECFDGSANARSFSYSVPEKATITCSAR